MEEGRFFESLFLGRCAQWDRIPAYMPYTDAVELAISKQPTEWSPLDPPQPEGKRLLDAVRKELEKLCISWPDDLVKRIIHNTGLYSALSTPVDYWHGVDAMFCCDLGEYAPLVTVDLKAREDAGDMIRNDHVIISKQYLSMRLPDGRTGFDVMAGVIADLLFEKLDSFFGGRSLWS